MRRPFRVIVLMLVATVAVGVLGWAFVAERDLLREGGIKVRFLDSGTRVEVISESEELDNVVLKLCGYREPESFTLLSGKRRIFAAKDGTPLFNVEVVLQSGGQHVYDPNFKGFQPLEGPGYGGIQFLNPDRNQNCKSHEGFQLASGIKVRFLENGREVEIEGQHEKVDSVILGFCGRAPNTQGAFDLGTEGGAFFGIEEHTGRPLAYVRVILQKDGRPVFREGDYKNPEFLNSGQRFENLHRADDCLSESG